MRQKWSRQHN